MKNRIYICDDLDAFKKDFGSLSSEIVISAFFTSKEPLVVALNLPDHIEDNVFISADLVWPEVVADIVSRDDFSPILKTDFVDGVLEQSKRGRRADWVEKRFAYVNMFPTESDSMKIDSVCIVDDSLWAIVQHLRPDPKPRTDEQIYSIDERLLVPDLPIHAYVEVSTLAERKKLFEQIWNKGGELIYHFLSADSYPDAPGLYDMREPTPIKPRPPGYTGWGHWMSDEDWNAGLEGVVAEEDWHKQPPETEDECIFPVT